MEIELDLGRGNDRLMKKISNDQKLLLLFEDLIGYLIIGMIVGGLIIGLGGYSLVDTLGASTVSMNENFVIGSGDNASFSIPAPCLLYTSDAADE